MCNDYPNNHDITIIMMSKSLMIIIARKKISRLSSVSQLLPNSMYCTYFYLGVQSDLTYPHTFVIDELADKVRELDK